MRASRARIIEAADTERDERWQQTQLYFERDGRLREVLKKLRN